jgi:hypothetical protein
MTNMNNTGSLDKLTPHYIKCIPTCPGSRENTVLPGPYSKIYFEWKEGRDTYSPGYIVASSTNAYTLMCSGWNHSRIRYAKNFPQYDSYNGQREK